MVHIIWMQLQWLWLHVCIWSVIFTKCLATDLNYLWLKIFLAHILLWSLRLAMAIGGQKVSFLQECSPWDYLCSSNWSYNHVQTGNTKQMLKTRQSWTWMREMVGTIEENWIWKMELKIIKVLILSLVEY